MPLGSEVQHPQRSPPRHSVYPCSESVSSVAHHRPYGILPAGKFERALRIDEAAFGPHHPNVARDVNNLDLVLKAVGDLEAAKLRFERALRIFEKQLGPDHPSTRTVRDNLQALE